jgi:hypothetical protein
VEYGGDGGGDDDDGNNDDKLFLFLCKIAGVKRVLFYLDISAWNTYLIKFMEINMGLVWRVIGCVIDGK